MEARRDNEGGGKIKRAIIAKAIVLDSHNVLPNTLTSFTDIIALELSGFGMEKEG
jgi:hypothetical protein